MSTSITHGSAIQDWGFEYSFELDSRIWFVVSAYFKCVALCLPILNGSVVKCPPPVMLRLRKLEWNGWVLPTAACTVEIYM